MKRNFRVVDENPADVNATPGHRGVILRLVKSAPEIQAIAAGQVDAVIDPASGEVFLLPEAQQALQEDHARMRDLLALSVDWYWEQDEHYRFISHSSTAAGNTAPYDHDIVGKLLWELPFENMQESDWRMHRQLLQWRSNLRDLELQCIDGAGEPHWISVCAQPTFGKDKEFKGYRGTMRDITLRRDSEAPLLAPAHAIEYVSEELLAGRDDTDRKRIANGLLAALPRTDYLRLLADLEPVTLVHGDVLYEAGEAIRHVYFPSDCLVSLLTSVAGHHALEVGLVGREGMIGIAVALGVGVSSVRALVLGTGTAMRMSTERFLTEFAKCLPLQEAVYRFTQAKLTHARQNAACNRFHVVEQRLARWLLMTRDRGMSDRFHLTQAFLADMLGVRRERVTHAACVLEGRKLITYARGNIRILDPKGLEAASCDCYAVDRGASTSQIAMNITKNELSTTEL